MIIVDEKRRSMGSVPLGQMHEGGESKDGEDMGTFHVLASEVLEAVEEKDPIALADALYAFFQECDMDYEQDEASEQEEY